VLLPIFGKEADTRTRGRCWRIDAHRAPPDRDPTASDWIGADNCARKTRAARANKAGNPEYLAAMEHQRYIAQPAASDIFQTQQLFTS
jgi:hypothetical protein